MCLLNLALFLRVKTVIMVVRWIYVEVAENFLYQREQYKKWFMDSMCLNNYRDLMVFVNKSWLINITQWIMRILFWNFVYKWKKKYAIKFITYSEFLENLWNLSKRIQHKHKHSTLEVFFVFTITTALELRWCISYWLIY